MERLTERSKTGTAFFDDDGSLIRGAGGAFHKKKDMTANFIHQRFVALDKIIDRLAAYEDAMPLERAQELARAEKDGRLIVLPCKVGDTVYRVLTTYDTAPIVTEIEIKSLSQAIELIGKIGEHKVLSYYLVREEAEAAMKKRE